MNQLSFAVHKFSSCDGCQLAFLNAGPRLLQLLADMRCLHFAEAGALDPEAKVDVAFVEGSISTDADRKRITQIRERCHWLVSIGACAVAGGVQALRQGHDVAAWTREIYPDTRYIDTLEESGAVSRHVRVDFELWGCPVSTDQVLELIRQLRLGIEPAPVRETVCAECKRRQGVCIVVSAGMPCTGPLTRAGCGALCPSLGRDCYGCSGFRRDAGTESLRRCFTGLGLDDEAVDRRLRHIHQHDDAGKS